MLVDTGQQLDSSRASTRSDASDSSRVVSDASASHGSSLRSASTRSDVSASSSRPDSPPFRGPPMLFVHGQQLDPTRLLSSRSDALVSSFRLESHVSGLHTRSSGRSLVSRLAPGLTSVQLRANDRRLRVSSTAAEATTNSPANNNASTMFVFSSVNSPLAHHNTRRTNIAHSVLCNKDTLRLRRLALQSSLKRHKRSPFILRCTHRIVPNGSVRRSRDYIDVDAIDV